MLWYTLAHPVSSASGSSPEGLLAQEISPPLSCMSSTKSTARVTTGHMVSAKRRSSVTSTWCHTPVATYAQKLLSLLASSTTPLRSWIGHEPSARWVVRHQSNAARAGSSSPAAVSAIAFSTWSHGSVWPPSNHGMAPEDSWVAAIDCGVWRHCAGVNTPGTPGTSGASNGHHRLPEVQRHALTDQRVQQRLGRPGDPRLLDHVPDQQPLVRRDRGMIV